MTEKTRNNKIRSRLLTVLLILLLAIVCYSGWKFYTEYKAFSAARNFYSNMHTERQLIQENEVRIMDFTELKKENPDIIAWIACEDTPIDYPVMQGADNIYYLRHLMDGTYNVVGSIFMDYQNAPDFTDENVALYGHHIQNEDTMFATLTNYAEQAYYDEHPTLTLYTPECTYTIEIFAGHVTKPDVTLPLQFEDKEMQQAYVSAAIEQSDFTTDILITEEDRLITLATCAYNFNNARYLLYGRLVPQ